MLASLALAALLMGPGFVLLMMGHRLAGMIWLFVAAFALMARSYRKPWRLGAVSCLIPPLSAAACYAFQIWLFGEVAPMGLVAFAATIGLLIGYLRARSHKIRRDDRGVPLADRTIGYLVVWVAAYVSTQLLAYFAVNSFGTRAGLVTGAFTTAMLASVSIVIWTRYRAVRAQAMAGILIAGLLVTGTVPVESVQAQSSITRLCRDRSGEIHERTVGPIDYTCPFGEYPVHTDCEIAVECLHRPPTGLAPAEQRTVAPGEAVPDPPPSPGGNAQTADDAAQEGPAPSPESVIEAIAQVIGDPETRPETQEEIVAATATVAAVLVAAGVAASTAQAVAVAIANALQAGAQMTAEEIQSVMVDAMRGDTGASGRDDGEDGNGQAEDSGPEEKPPPESEEERAARESRERVRRDREEWEVERARREAEANRLEKIQDLAIAIGDEDLIERTVSERIYNPDGSINTPYLNRLQAIIRDRLAREEATSDPDFEDNSWQRILWEAGGKTMDEAKDSFIVRAGIGYLSWGTSEVAFQGHNVVDKIRSAAERLADKGQTMSRGDALRIATAEFIRENMPVNTLQVFNRMREGKDVGTGELAMSLLSDAFAMMEVGDAGQRITGVSPGTAFDNAARRVLPKDVYERGAESAQQIGREVRERLSGVAAKVQDIDARGTEWLNQKTGGIGERVGFGTPDRLNPSQARVQLEEGRVSSDVQTRIEEVTTTGSTAGLDQAHELGRQRGQAKVESFERSLGQLEDARRGGDADAIARARQQVRDDMIRIQGDKHGMNALNARNADGTGHSTIEGFNREMGATHSQTDDAVRQRLAEMYEVRSEDVQVVNITNEAGSGPRVDPDSPGRPDPGLASARTPDGRIDNSRAARSEPGTVDGPETGRLPDPETKPPRNDKVGMDRDLTMRVRTVNNGRMVYEDVPATVTGRVYNEEWYRAATGREPPPFDSTRYDQNHSTDFADTHLDEDGFLGDPVKIEDPQAFARRTDQATTDRLHPEAYGTGQADLDAATKDSYRHRDLSDAAGTAGTIEYKVDHWMNEAERLQEMASKPQNAAIRNQLLEQASAHMEEAQRQLVKQYGNMVVTRTEAMRMFGNAPDARIPAALADKVNVLRQVQQGRLSPAQGEEVLKQMGSSTKQLSRQMSAYVEGLQILRSPSGTSPHAGGSPFPMQGWQDEFREDDG